MENLKMIWNDLLASVPALIKAILLTLIAWLIASLVRKLIIKGGRKAKVPQMMVKSRISSDERSAFGILKALGNLGFFIVFMLFLPGIFTTLNVPQLSGPLGEMLNGFFGFIPSLIGACLILFIGHLLAKVVKELVTSISAGFGIDKLSEKVKPGQSGFKLSELIGKLLYALIMFTVIIAALHALGISAISQPLVEMLQTIVHYIPSIIAALIVIGIGVYLIAFIANLLENLIKGTAIDRLVKKSAFNEGAEGYVVLSKPIVLAVKYLLIFFIVVEALDMLQLDIFTAIGKNVLGYLPNAIGAFAILAIGFFAAKFCVKMLKNMGMCDTGAAIVKGVIYVLSVFLAISQLDIAKGFVEPVFLIIVAALAIAFALAFGIGGRDFAAKTLEDMRKKKKDIE